MPVYERKSIPASMGRGITNGTLDDFEVRMRLIAERAGIITYAINYQLAPEAKFPE